MADDGFSPEMLDAYFRALARQPDEGAGSATSTRWTPEYIQANAPALGRALVEHGAMSASALGAFERAGIDPTLTLDEVLTPHLREQVLMAEGRERARPRFQQALDRAERHGYQELRQRIEGMVEAEAQRHARRGMRRSGGIGSDAVAAPAAPSPARSAVAPPLPVDGSLSPMPMTPTRPGASSPLPSAGELFQGVQRLGAPMSSAPAPAPPLPVARTSNPPLGIDYGAPEFSPILAMPPLGLRNLPGTAGGSGSVMGPMPPQPQPMPPTLSGMENPPELTREPFRPRGRVVAQTLGAIGGGMGGGAVGGPPGAIAGGGMGSAGAGQLYDAAADWMSGTQERAPVLSGQTALDAAAGAIPAAGPAIGAGMRAAGRGASEVVGAAMRRPTVSNLLASAAIGGGITAASTGNTQEVEVPTQFVPMDRNEYFRQNRQSRKSLDEVLADAEARVTSNPAYQGLVEDGKTTAARRMIEQARKNAEEVYNKAEAGRAGEETRLEEGHRRYRADLEESRKVYFAGRAAEEQAAKDRLANTPFRQRYPILSGALPWAGIGIAAGIPFAGRALGNAMTWAPRSASRQLDAATARAEAATSANNMRDFNIAAGEVNNAMRARPQSMLDQRTAADAAKVGAKNVIPYLTTGAAGGGLAAEANMFPYQWDALNLPPGDAQREARNNALDVMQYGERGLMGSIAGASGLKAANILTGPLRREPNWARAELAAKNPPTGSGGGGGGGGRGGSGGNLPSLVERRARANPDDPRGDWVPRSEPAVRGVTSYVSREGRNEVFLDAGGNWQKRLPNGQTQFLDSRASRALDAGRPPPKYRRISEAEPNLLAQYG